MGQSKLKSTKEKYSGPETKQDDYYGYVRKDLKKFSLLTLALVLVLIVIFFLDRHYSFLGKLVEKLMPFFIKGR